jgi:hypothetical protein
MLSIVCATVGQVPAGKFPGWPVQVLYIMGTVMTSNSHLSPIGEACLAWSIEARLLRLLRLVRLVKIKDLLRLEEVVDNICASAGLEPACRGIWTRVTFDGFR